MKRLLVFVSVLTVCMCLCAPARADVFTVYDNIAGNVYLAPGNSASGSFDINALLASDPQFNAPYTITAAAYTFIFADDGEMYPTGTTNVGGYFLQGRTISGSYTYWNVARYADHIFHDEYESVGAFVEGDAVYDGTDLMVPQTSGILSTTRDRVYWSDSYNCYLYDTYHRNKATGYVGSIRIEELLSPTALASLSSDGILDFSVKSMTGDSIYTYGALTFEVLPNPVPTPSAFLLGGLGLSVAGWRMKRRKASS